LANQRVKDPTNQLAMIVRKNDGRDEIAVNQLQQTEKMAKNFPFRPCWSWNNSTPSWWILF